MWTTECQVAFDTEKSLSHAPVLAAPDFSTPFKLEVDASAVGTGAVLLQRGEDGIDHPVAYFPESSTDTRQIIPPLRRKPLLCC